MFALGKRHVLLFLCKGQKCDVCFNFEKIRYQVTKHIPVEILHFSMRCFSKTPEAQRSTFREILKKCITVVFEIHFLIPLRIYMKHGLDVCRQF